MQQEYVFKASAMRQVAAALMVLTLAACGGKVTIRDSFPTPVVEPLAMNVGIYMSPAFLDFEYVTADNKLKFEVGSKQAQLYRTVFDALFQSATAVTSTSANGAQDLIIEPVLEEYAFLAPAETATDFFAVSLKYQVRLYESNGQLIGYFPIVAYGKNRTGLINKNASLGDATSSALRDAAAALVTGFRDAIETRTWKQPEENT